MNSSVRMNGYAMRGRSAITTSVHTWLARYRYPLFLFALLRLWLSFWAGLFARLIPPASTGLQYHGMTQLSGTINEILWAPWQRWDTIWYAKIAEQGYSANNVSVAFFPLYPLMIRLSARVLGGSVAAGVLISSAGALVSFILLYELALQLYGEAPGRRAALYLAVFPTAFFLFAAYTESLFLALVLGAYLSVRAQKWEPGCALAALAALTRPQGMLLVLPLAVEFVLQYRRKQVSLFRGLNLLLVAAGSVAYLLFLTVRFGSPLIWFQAQASWHQSSLPGQSIGAALGQALNAHDLVSAIVSLPDPVFALAFLGFTVCTFLRLSPTMSVYMAVIVLPPLFGMTTYSPYLPLASMSRYVAVAFPAFILLARLQSSFWSRLLLGLSFLLQTLWLMLFVAWVFVG